jgi:hypothetical protein
MEYPYSILGKDACQQTASFSCFQAEMENHTAVSSGYNTVVLYCPILENCFYSPTPYLRLPYAWSAVDDLEELGII